jgi:hypothetical protein
MSLLRLKRGRRKGQSYRDYAPGVVFVDDFYVVKTGFGKEEVCREYDVRPPYVVCVTFDGRVITVRDSGVKTVVVSQE